ncbi:MarR family transcriptional regulator [Pseudonocardia yunnanensis]|uniref:MarR family winged helix-turn-helix transcriptional regulator n=1 Tax=Pseudonocardia yunnanensis TaxID=58107 RepID=A0ABW4EP83_9PSEU
MDSDELRSEIDISMWRFIADVVLRTQAVAQQVGLGGSDCQFVALLGVHGPLTAGRLAELSGLTTGTVTGVLDRLEKAGYARRVRDATDRRKVLVTPVPEAMATLAEYHQAHGEHLDAVLRRRDAAQLQVIADFLAELSASGSSSGSRDGGSGTTASSGS